MSITTLVQAKSQSRVILAAEDSLIQGYLDAAEYYASQYLNRTVTPDDASAANAQANSVAASQAAINAFVAANPARPFQGLLAEDAAAAASATYRMAYEKALRDRFAMAITPAFTQAVLLIVASWYVNREAIITNFTQAIELPYGAKNLLDIDRVQLGV
jgi:hypothetical protein